MTTPDDTRERLAGHDQGALLAHVVQEQTGVQLAWTQAQLVVERLQEFGWIPAETEEERIEAGKFSQQEMDQLLVDINAHQHAALIRGFADIMQEIDDENGTGGGWAHYASLACMCMNDFAAALRDSGWVDPGGAEQLRLELAEALADLRKAREKNERLQAQRDALLPVVEAAREYARAWDVYANPSSHPGPAQEDRILTKAHAHKTLLGAVSQGWCTCDWADVSNFVIGEASGTTVMIAKRSPSCPQHGPESREESTDDRSD